MINRFTIGFAVLLVTGAFSQRIPRRQSTIDETVTRSYVGSDVQIEGEGVCNVTESSVNCWNMDGAPDKDLDDQVRAYFASNNSQPYQIRFGKKNRMLILHKSGARSVGANFEGTDNNNGYLYSVVNSRQDSTTSNWVIVAADKSESVCSVIANIYGLPGSPPVDLQTKSGASVQFQTESIRFDSVRPTSPANASTPRNTYMPFQIGKKSWDVFLAVTPESRVSYQFSAVDKAGEQVKYVDADGNAISPVEYLEWQRSQSNTPGFRPYDANAKYRNAQLIQTQNLDGALLLTTNVNPSSMALLRISGTNSRRVQIDGFPLDPKG